LLNVPEVKPARYQRAWSALAANGTPSDLALSAISARLVSGDG